MCSAFLLKTGPACKRQCAVGTKLMLTLEKSPAM